MSRVLLVEDDSALADLYALKLRLDGHLVKVVADSASAVAVFEADHPEVVCVDLMLPDGDGLALTRELKKRDPALEVIVITAYGSVRKAMEATKGAGAFHVLEKPFEPEVLRAFVREQD